MKIALTGEGPTDYGKRDYMTKEWLEGPVQKYAHKIASELISEEIEFAVLEKANIKDIRVQRRSLQGLEGLAVPAKKFSTWMGEQGLEKGIYYCDADREGAAKNNSREAERRFAKIYNEVAKGLEETKAIPMVALRMIECWMLGDKKALESAYDVVIEDKKMPNKPEFLWGDKHDPDSDYPKNYLKRLIEDEDGNYQGNQEYFCNVANASDIDTVRNKCYISFQKFYDDFSNMVCE